LTFKPGVLNYKPPRINQKAKEFLDTVRKGLDEGNPVQLIYKALESENVDYETIKMTIGIASDGKLSRCDTCDLVYSASCEYCGRCGKKLTRVT